MDFVPFLSAMSPSIGCANGGRERDGGKDVTTNESASYQVCP